MTMESRLGLILRVLSNDRTLQEKYLEKYQLLMVRLDQLSNDIDDFEMCIKDDRRCELLPHELKELNDHKELQSSIKTAIPLLLLSMVNKIDLNAH